MTEAQDSERRKATRQALALPDGISNPEHERERYYIRSAVDNMRRTATHIKRVEDALSETETELSYSLTCYSSAIRYLFSKKDKDKRPDASEKMIGLILETARIIRAGTRINQN